MGKLTTYLLVMLGVMLLFYYTGLIDDTGTLMGLILNPSGFSSETMGLGLQLRLILTGIGTAGIILIGVLTHNVELALMGTFTLWLSSLLGDFVGVFQKVHSVNPVIAILLFSPILFLFAITLIEFWRGRD